MKTAVHYKPYETHRCGGHIYAGNAHPHTTHLYNIFNVQVIMTNAIWQSHIYVVATYMRERHNQCTIGTDIHRLNTYVLTITYVQYTHSYYNTFIHVCVVLQRCGKTTDRGEVPLCTRRCRVVLPAAGDVLDLDDVDPMYTLADVLHRRGQVRVGPRGRAIVLAVSCHMLDVNVT